VSSLDRHSEAEEERTIGQDHGIQQRYLAPRRSRHPSNCDCGTETDQSKLRLDRLVLCLAIVLALGAAARALGTIGRYLPLAIRITIVAKGRGVLLAFPGLPRLRLGIR
jgi:hypothetical protein